MRGHIKKRYINSYSIYLSMGSDPVTGKRKQKWVTVHGTKKDAERKLSELLHQLDNGTYVQPSKYTIADFLQQWLNDYCKANLSPNTTETYEFFVRKHITPAIGQIPLSSLKPEHLQRLYSDKLNGGLGNRSVRYIHVTMHKALKTAVKLGMIARNPADSLDIPKVKRHDIRIMNESDIHLFLEYARDTAYYTLFYTALFTGMRRSELLALRWQDIDLLLGQISVNHTLHQLHSGEIVVKQTKTAKGRRLIALSPSTIAALREHKTQQEELKKSLGVTLADSDLVFCQPNGTPFLPDSITHAWRKLATRTGLKGIRLHDARHTHASLMLKQGIHPKIVQERLGHASIQITLDTYSHVAPGLQAAAAKRFDEIIIPTSENEALEKVC